MGRLYTFLLLSVAAFAWLASNLSADFPAAGLQPREADRLARFDSDPGHPGAGEDSNLIVLGRARDGHFYADVEINGTPITMLVDTGASGVALSEEDAHRVGIATTIGMNEHIGQGAGGAVFGDIVQIDSVRLGSTEASNLRGVVLRGGQISLLGQNFLQRFASVEIAGDRMILR